MRIGSNEGPIGQGCCAHCGTELASRDWRCTPTAPRLHTYGHSALVTNTPNVSVYRRFRKQTPTRLLGRLLALALSFRKAAPGALVELSSWQPPAMAVHDNPAAGLNLQSNLLPERGAVISWAHGRRTVSHPPRVVSQEQPVHQQTRTFLRSRAHRHSSLKASHAISVVSA